MHGVVAEKISLKLAYILLFTMNFYLKNYYNSKMSVCKLRSLALIWNGLLSAHAYLRDIIGAIEFKCM